MAGDTRYLDLVIRGKDEGASAAAAGVRQKVEKELGALGGLKEGFGRTSAVTPTPKIFQGGGGVPGQRLVGGPRGAQGGGRPRRTAEGDGRRHRPEPQGPAGEGRAAAPPGPQAQGRAARGELHLHAKADRGGPPPGGGVARPDPAGHHL